MARIMPLVEGTLVVLVVEAEMEDAVEMVVEVEEVEDVVVVDANWYACGE